MLLPTLIMRSGLRESVSSMVGLIILLVTSEAATPFSPNPNTPTRLARSTLEPWLDTMAVSVKRTPRPAFSMVLSTPPGL